MTNGGDKPAGQANNGSVINIILHLLCDVIDIGLDMRRLRRGEQHVSGFVVLFAGEVRVPSGGVEP